MKALHELHWYSLVQLHNVMSSSKFLQHNQDRKHRTYVYTLIVTETLEDWEESVNIGMPLSFTLLSYNWLTHTQKSLLQQVHLVPGVYWTNLIIFWRGFSPFCHIRLDHFHYLASNLGPLNLLHWGEIEDDTTLSVYIQCKWNTVYTDCSVCILEVQEMWALLIVKDLQSRFLSIRQLYLFYQIFIFEHLKILILSSVCLFFKTTHPPDRCGISRYLLNRIIITQVCLGLIKTIGHSKMCHTTQYRGCCNWHADRGNVHESCYLWIEYYVKY